MDTIYATEGLLEYLGEYARERDPDPVSVSLSITKASELDLPEMDPDTPVFTHFYMPQAGSSVNFVFGVDLGTPAGQTQGQFVSHPDGMLDVFESDDLREVIFVGVPPYDGDSIAAFGRNGDRKKLVTLDVEPEHGELEG